jgi:hypothetical protein
LGGEGFFGETDNLVGGEVGLPFIGEKRGFFPEVFAGADFVSPGLKIIGPH